MAQLTELDDFDRKILRALQENADYSMAELGDIVGLSHTPCWRRIKRLEAEGVIERRVTLLNAAKLNMGVSVHAYVVLKTQETQAVVDFEAAIDAIPEVVECYSTTGDKDYLLRVVVNSVEHYEQLLKGSLTQLPNVGSVSSTFALRQVKYTTRLPL